MKLMTRRCHFFFLFSGPNIVRILSQAFGHVLHFPAQGKVSHIDWIWIVVVWRCASIL